MAHHRLDRKEAFALLTQHSNRTNTKLVVLALELVTQAEDAARQSRT